MANMLSSRPESLERLSRTLPSVSATSLVAGMQKVTRTVMTEGAVVITRHVEPTMVLMSVDRYLTLVQAAAPNLDALTRQFDDMFAQMQGPDAAQATADAFAMEPQAMDIAAVRAAGGVRKAGKTAKTTKAG